MRIALIADTHLSSRVPECLTNWHGARAAVRRLGTDLTINLGDVTFDGQHHPDDLALAGELVAQWPHPMLCVPGNHDVGDASGEAPFDPTRRAAYCANLGADHWSLTVGDWLLLGLNAQLFGTGSDAEQQQWQWIDERIRLLDNHTSVALFLHRPLARPHAGEHQRRGRYVPEPASDKLLHGPLRRNLKLVASGHLHQYLDRTVAGVRHLWLPSTAYLLGDDLQARIGEKLVGLGVLDLGDGDAAFDLWCPQGMVPHQVGELEFYRRKALERSRERLQMLGREAV